MLSTGNMAHAGIMVNYQCNAACRHCLYSCSPSRNPGYITEENAEELCRLLRKGGCRSVHIGGGEPFLDTDGLIMTAGKIKKAGIALEYTETNAFWVMRETSDSDITEKLKMLASAGIDCYCISIDPFHAEYIPYGAPLKLAMLCEKAGVDYFLWKREFLGRLSKLDPAKTHTREELEKLISVNYIYETAVQYGIGYGGRAINIEREMTSTANLFTTENLSNESSPCRNLLSTGHFHADKDLYFIPPRCTGIRLPLSEAVEGIPEGKYPAFEALYHRGIAGLLKLAGEHGFISKAGYPTKCSLCFDLRMYLAGLDQNFPELDRNHYEESFKYYADTNIKYEK